MAIKSYPTDCTAPGCAHEAWLDHRKPPIGAGEPIPKTGNVIQCDCGRQASVRPATPPTLGIVVEQVDHQLGTVWKSNAEYNDWVKYGNPVIRNGEVVGHREVVTMSDQERKSHRDQVIKDMEKVAAKNNLTLEQAHAVRAERTREKRAKEIEQGLTPTVSEPKPMDYGA